LALDQVGALDDHVTAGRGRVTAVDPLELGEGAGATFQDTEAIFDVGAQVTDLTCHAALAVGYEMGPPRRFPTKAFADGHFLSSIT
jgi:hypothetical protein